ncbi:transporter substrate-binding domain-containing protein [Paucibacter sp. DJ1R-11]|uniref:transporter substrate-binding domain-containing protein n=1 Tax=Paucibacter sp. DJ1R-11 TaxID=2893556 RepID=UPI0021E4654B|nr:transporter substrate-binding domain-containing protein [Paucibacter sp. DJ1R-11]MCV2363433.1 transporter substrate-binding domain-containing protein [Paucibacter sp. DJ1R-11]
MRALNFRAGPWLRGVTALAGLLCWVGLLLLPRPAQAAELRICQADPQRYAYRMALTRLILERTERPGERSQLRAYADGPDPTQERCLGLLRQGQVDLAYLPPSEELLREFSSIKIDLHKGMLGYRLLLIHKKDRALFEQVNSLADLRQLTGGFGRQWADFGMFERNGLPVVGVAQGSALLPMLQSGRFHYFHRGLHEAWAELEANPEIKQLMVEPRIALHYPFPVYYMFRADKLALRQRFEKGLERIQADGSFDQLFLQHFQTIARRARLDSRTVIEIEQPLPQGLPPVDTQLWRKS